MTRRTLLRRAALLAGAPVLAGARAEAAIPAPQDLEIVTVTDTSIAARWTTAVPADTHLVVRDPRGRAVAEITRTDLTAAHLAEVTGLTPGTPYAVEARSGGLLATPRLLATIDYAALPAGVPTDPRQLLRAVGGTGMTSAAPAVVTTLVPPDGPLLATIALTNDLHLGETVSGVIQGDFPPPVRQAEGLPAYPLLMARALVAEATARGADVLLVAGDLTAEAARVDAEAAREVLSAFGTQARSGVLTRGSWLAVRGNHDRVHGSVDTVGEVFGLPRQQLTVAHVGGLRIIALDTSTQQAGGALEAAQLEALRAELRRDGDTPTLVLGHHPVTQASASTTIGGRPFDLDPASAVALETAYGAAPGVLLHHAGHTHRNRVTTSPAAPRVEFLEVGAAKEYPGCVTMLRIHTGGYQVSTHPLTDPQARAWTARSGTQFAGYYPAYTLGSLGDRNHVVRRDLSGLAGLPARPVAMPHGHEREVVIVGAAAAAGVVAAATVAVRHARARGGAGIPPWTSPS